MHQELLIDDLPHTIDPAGTVEVTRISASVTKVIIKSISDVVVSAITSLGGGNS